MTSKFVIRRVKVCTWKKQGSGHFVFSPPTQAVETHTTMAITQLFVNCVPSLIGGFTNR